jgi:uncharacterized peroxidase-related enzyme
MTFIETVPEDAATGPTARLYAEDAAARGYVPNYTRLFALRPEVYAAWKQLIRAVASGLDTRRYELATLAAARSLRSTYCAMAHGLVLRERFFDAETLLGIASAHATAGLDPVDVAIMDFADHVARDASSISREDVERLRGVGLSDDEIFDVALVAAARCFFSTVLHAMGAQPDLALRASLEPPVRDALTVDHSTLQRPTAGGC